MSLIREVPRVLARLAFYGVIAAGFVFLVVVQAARSGVRSHSGG
jgi:hypothetical protein